MNISNIVRNGGNEMSEVQKEISEEEKMELKTLAAKKKYVITVSVASFLTFCCCSIFFFILYRSQEVSAYIQNIVKIVQPLTIGIMLAYLLNPIVNTIQDWLHPLLEKRINNKKKAKSLSLMLGITGAWVFFAVIILILVAMILPTITDSVMNMIRTFPDEVNNLLLWINEVVEDGSQLEMFMNEIIVRASTWFEGWLQNTFLPQSEYYIGSIMSSAVAGVKLILNIFIGFVVSIYVLISKEKFAGQAKKIIYAVFKPAQGNVIIDTARKSHELFGGFISGKLLDSLIIGILAYIVLSIMKMPYTMLVSVIIGVTNVIPFFGPFIGAIPSFFIILLQSPVKSLYFLIFILILQQIDGNIIGPKILGNSTGLTAFWIVFSTTFFGGLWGFIGMVLGVPLTAVIYHIAGQVLSCLLKKRGIPDDTNSYIKLKKINKETNEPIYGNSSAIDNIIDESCLHE